MKETRKWGDYIDVRINAPDLLEKELVKKKPKRVLLGSTTECFGPYEEKYGITGRIIEILNRHGVYYSILTRSPFVRKYIPYLKKGFCEHIYFTVNNYSGDLKRLIEPKSPDFPARNETVKALIKENIPVVPYVSPVLPFMTDIENIFNIFSGATSIDFEGLNFNLGSISDVIEAVEKIYPEKAVLFHKMRDDGAFYEKVWSEIKAKIRKTAIRYKKNQEIYIHGLRSYFENKY